MTTEAGDAVYIRGAAVMPVGGRRRKIIEFRAHCSPLCTQEYILMMWDLMRSALEYDFSDRNAAFSAEVVVWAR